MRSSPVPAGAGIRTRYLSCALGIIALITLQGAPATASTAGLVAPKPTSTAASPQAPDPHPPAGGTAPDGSIPGGPLLAKRGAILPAGAPKLPAGLTGKAWMLTDLDTGQVLAARDPHGRYQPASVLKLLTALTVLPTLPGRTVITVSPAAAAAEGSAVGLLAGGRYTVDELFHALFLVSANDAAAALAQSYGGVTKTVADMNSLITALGGYDTLVQTPSGLDGWQQLTSAYDLTLVLRAAVNDPRLLAYDQTPSTTIPPKSSSTGHVGVYQFDNQSLNFLTGVPGALLAKTGYTDAALHTYVCAATRNGRRLGVVFLRNQRTPLDQWQQAAALLAWGYRLPAGTAPVGQLPPPQTTPAPAVSEVPATSPASAVSAVPATSTAPAISPTPATSPATGTGPGASTSAAVSPAIGSLPASPPGTPGQAAANLAAPLAAAVPVDHMIKAAHRTSAAGLNVFTSLGVVASVVAALRLRLRLRRRRQQTRSRQRPLAR